MKRDLEAYLWERVPMAGSGQPGVRDTIEGMVSDGLIKSPKQAWRTLEKWAERGLYEYGTSIDLGWRVRAREENDGE